MCKNWDRNSASNANMCFSSMHYLIKEEGRYGHRTLKLITWGIRFNHERSINNLCPLNASLFNDFIFLTGLLENPMGGRKCMLTGPMLNSHPCLTICLTNVLWCYLLLLLLILVSFPLSYLTHGSIWLVFNDVVNAGAILHWTQVIPR